MDCSKFDFHIHSTASDGTDTPAQIVDKIKGLGIHSFSITDHDNVDGVKEVLNNADLNNLNFYTGVEFSCRTGKLCHILGYGFDVNSPYIDELMALQRQIHSEKMRQRLQGLKDVYGICFNEEDLSWLASQNRRGKPHLARLLIKNGYADSIEEAFKKYHSRIHTNVAELSPRTAIQAIKNAGGIAIWAHPLGGEGEIHLSGQRFFDELNILISCGVDGLECFYSRYTDAEKQFLLECAENNKLLVSGGSDYHGKNKDIFLGQLGSENAVVDISKITTVPYLLNKL